MLDLILEPFAGIRIGKVHQRHSSLPEIGLPNLAIAFFDQIPLFFAFLEHGTALTDVRVDPGTDMQALVLMQAFECRFDVAEEALIPFEVSPMEFAHPITVVVEGA